jgi:aromatic ring-opening dioxygenase catalytic subunit (LigB family)
MSSDLPLTRSAWEARLATLPGSPNQIPAFFFAHGSPFLAVSSTTSDAARNPHMRAMLDLTGLESPFANFLRDFGPALLAKYQPKGILVFSAHWETEGEQLGTCPRTLRSDSDRPHLVSFFLSFSFPGMK